MIIFNSYVSLPEGNMIKLYSMVSLPQWQHWSSLSWKALMKENEELLARQKGAVSLVPWRVDMLRYVLVRCFSVSTSTVAFYCISIVLLLCDLVLVFGAISQCFSVFYAVLRRFILSNSAQWAARVQALAPKASSEEDWGYLGSTDEASCLDTWLHGVYPLVNIQQTMENHNF